MSRQRLSTEKSRSPRLQSSSRELLLYIRALAASSSPISQRLRCAKRDLAMLNCLFSQSTKISLMLALTLDRASDAGSERVHLAPYIS
eukprot:4043135-Pleurochrysis_carterae.AAC.4